MRPILAALLLLTLAACAERDGAAPRAGGFYGATGGGVSAR